MARAMLAMQAQSTRDARLAIRPRGDAVDAAAVDIACNHARTVVRTWAMRVTLHMLAADDAGWVVDLYRPPREALGSRQRQLGLDEGLLRRAMPAIAEVLAGRALTRRELVAELARAGVSVPPKGQAPAHLVGYAARQGLVCRGPDRSDDEPTYVLLAEWIGAYEPREPDQARAELARRYIRARGPAGAKDLAYWSGLPLGAAHRALGQVVAEFEEVEVEGEQAWADPGSAAAGNGGPCVRLVPHFDEYLLGYRSRALALPARFVSRIQAGGGWVQAAVVVDGHIAGTWSQRRESAQTVVVVTPFARLDPAVLPGLEAEAADLGRFLGTAAGLQITAA